MTTKRHWVEDKAFGPKCFGEYNNVILNESQKCLDTKLVQSKAILNNNVKSDYRNLEHPLKGKNKGCWTKNDKNPKPFEYDCNETVSMKRKQRTEKTSLNNSTLSLHISAYESFNVTDIIKQDELFADKTKNNVLKTMQICVGSFFTNPFEIPRQQEEGKSSAPEIMQFKASQKLLNPNDSVVATEKENTRTSISRISKMSNIPATMQRREAMSKRKVLLMGKSGAGKTSMRSIIFANYIARDCDRLGPTLEIEHAHVRFLGNMALHLWDCGGQETFMENYMTSQRDQIFKNVQVLIYVFDVESREIDKDYRNYQGCLEALLQNSPQATVFCLIHKMDLVSEENRNKVFEEKVEDIRRITNSTAERLHSSATIECHPSSIWDETLYKAWSAIVYHLVPNVTAMEQKLNQFAEIIEADEILLFEKATFLVVAQVSKKEFTDHHRFEKVSNIIKQFKLSCSRMGAQFDSILVRNSEFSAFIDSFTNNTYIMSICEGSVSAAAVAMNIKSARKHFEKLDAK